MVLALVMTAGSAWSVLTVLEDFDDGATKVNIQPYGDMTADAVTISTDTPSGSGYSNAIDLVFNDSDDACYFGVLPFESTTDLSGGTYINFYLKATANVDEPIFQAYGEGWSPGMSIIDWATLPTEWTYFSFPRTDFLLGWGFGAASSDTDWEAIWQIEWYWRDATHPDTTIFIDYVTLTDTPEEGMLGGAEGEGEGESEGEGEPAAPPVTSGAPAAGLLGLGLVAAACAFGGAATLRKK